MLMHRGMGVPTRRRLDVRSPTMLAIPLGVALCAAYLRWTPAAPDLAAQVARSRLVQHAGQVTWWTGWFGGLSTPSYSVLAPSWMAHLGVRATGVVAVVVASAALSRLLRDAPRPRAGAVAVTAMVSANLFDGRVTFTAGLAAAALALLALRGRRRLASAVLALISFLFSPLAGLFLGIVATAVFLTRRDLRPHAVAAGATLLITAVIVAVLFPDTGRMPFGVTDMIPAAIAAVLVAVVCDNRIIQATALLQLAALPIVFVIPGAIGNNITRLTWVCAVPVLVAFAPLPKTRLAVAVAIAAAWPVTDLVQQLHNAQGPSTAAAYYRPLITALNAQRDAAGAASAGARLEVLDSTNHWSSVYLVNTVSLARGWDRQADVANNPIFYRPGALTTASYQDWLSQLAVWWVAVPDVPLDYAAQGEADLINSDPSYLQLAWSSPTWRLYRVRQPAPLAINAIVQGVDPDGITLRTTSSAAIRVQVRWSPYFELRYPDGQAVEGSCLSDVGGWTSITAPGAGTYRLTTDFDVARRLRAASCVPARGPAGGEVSPDSVQARR